MYPCEPCNTASELLTFRKTNITGKRACDNIHAPIGSLQERVDEHVSCRPGSATLHGVELVCCFRRDSNDAEFLLDAVGAYNAQHVRGMVATGGIDIIVAVRHVLGVGNVGFAEPRGVQLESTVHDSNAHALAGDVGGVQPRHPGVDMRRQGFDCCPGSRVERGSR